MTTPTTLWAQATDHAKREHLRPITCQRLDTGELIWLVQSRTDPSHHYLLTVSGETIQCPCPQAQHRGICAHAAAVRLALQAERQHQATTAHPLQRQPTPPTVSRHPARSASEREQERRRRAEAERRERALLWTDDKPFSLWK